MSLTAEQIKSAPLQVQRVDTPEWGGDGFVFVRELPATYASRIVEHQAGKPTEEEFLSAWSVWCLCDESGSPLFDGDDIPDWVVNRSFAALSRVGLKAISLNSLESPGNEDTGKN